MASVPSILSQNSNFNLEQMDRRKNVIGHQERQQSILFSFCFTFTKCAIIRILVHVFPTAISTIKIVLGKVTVIITSTIPNVAKGTIFSATGSCCCRSR